MKTNTPLSRTNGRDMIAALSFLLVCPASLSAASDPPVAITSPTAGSVYEMDDTVTVTVSLDTSITGPRTVQIHNNGTVIGAASPTSFIQGWTLGDGSIIGFQSATMFNYVHEDEYFFFDGSFTNNRFTGNFSVHSIAGMASGTGTLDFSFDTNGLLTVTTSGDAPLGVRNLTGGKSSTCTSYRFLWQNPPAGQLPLTAVVTHTDTTTSQTNTIASLPVSITVNGPPAAPEIAVEQPTGKGLKDAESKRNFGRVKVRKSSKAMAFTIRNTGNATLTGLAITKNGANARDFIVTAPVKATLTPGASTTFKVTFKPKRKGPRKAAIHIKNNDADENPFDINLTGFGTRP